MSNLYGTSQIASIDEMANSDVLMELYLADDILRGSDEEIQKFCESEEAQILVEKRVLNKPTIHRLSKSDDLKRRIKLTAYQMAKDAGDPNWAKLVKYQGLKKQYANKILAKYGRKAQRVATVAQKNYIKKARSIKATAAENRAQAAK